MSAGTPQRRAVLSGHDRAVLRAVAAGRCSLSRDPSVRLVVDGIVCSDQFVGRRLVRAGLLDGVAGPARLTRQGASLLAGARPSTGWTSTAAGTVA